MKKFLLMLVFGAFALTMNAQVFVGGEVGFWRNWDANRTTFTLAPEVGYTLDNHWALGVALGYNHDYEAGVALNGFKVNPYGRYTFVKLGPVSLFCDGGFGFGTYKIKGAGSSLNAWEVGVKPGFAIGLSKNLSLVTHVGFLGYRDADEGLRDFADFDTGFGFKFTGYDLSFGLYYSF